MSPGYGKWEIKTNTVTDCCASLTTTGIGKYKWNNKTVSQSGSVTGTRKEGKQDKQNDELKRLLRRDVMSVRNLHRSKPKIKTWIFTNTAVRTPHLVITVLFPSDHWDMTKMKLYEVGLSAGPFRTGQRIQDRKLETMYRFPVTAIEIRKFQK